MHTPFSERLRSLREAAGLSQAALAARAGTTQATVARLESGRRHTRPSLEMVDRLAQALAVDLTAFAGCYPTHKS